MLRHRLAALALAALLPAISQAAPVTLPEFSTWLVPSATGAPPLQGGFDAQTVGFFQARLGAGPQDAAGFDARSPMHFWHHYGEATAYDGYARTINGLLEESINEDPLPVFGQDLAFTKLSVSAVPEPIPLTALFAGMGVIGAFARRRAADTK